MNESQPRGRWSRIASPLATVALILFVFVAGVWVGGHPRQTGVDQLPSALRDRLIDEDRTALATQALAILKDGYYKPIDGGVVDRIEGLSVETLIKELGDPYTSYLDPEEFRELQADNQGKYAGIGVSWHPEDDTAVIVDVFPNTPAQRAGIVKRDVVTAVDGVNVTPDDRYAAMQNVAGQPDTTVTLTIARAGVPARDYTMTREEIRRSVVDSRVEQVEGERIGYVRLDQFTEGSGAAFRSAVRRLIEQKVTAVVFDLRGDPGGLVSEAVDIAGVLLPRDSLVATTKDRSGSGDPLRTDDNPVDASVPLVVLVDRGSASASEIVAGALRDAKRATLIGQRTFGKALIQTTRTLANGGAIKFTTASYLTPGGFDLAVRGLLPDIQVTDDPATEPDEALQRALKEAASR